GMAEFVGRLQTAGAIGTRLGLLGKTPKDISVLQKAGESAKLFGLGAGFEQIVKNLAEQIEPTEATYGAEGKEAILRDMAIGAIFSLAHSGVKGIWSGLRPTEQARALRLLGLKKGATVREIIQGARRMALKTYTDNVKGLEQKFKDVMAARELLIKGPKRDIVFRKQPPKPPAQITGAAETAVPIRPALAKPGVSPKKGVIVPPKPTQVKPEGKVEQFAVKQLQKTSSLKGITDKEALSIVRAKTSDEQEAAIKQILSNRGIDVEKIDIEARPDLAGVLDEERPTVAIETPEGGKVEFIPSHDRAINLAVEEAMRDVTHVIDIQVPEFQARPAAAAPKLVDLGPAKKKEIKHEPAKE
ncbi:hypothetical protein LCGC14_3038980, partial [marine sediment metagenome]